MWKGKVFWTKRSNATVVALLTLLSSSVFVMLSRSLCLFLEETSLEFTVNIFLQNNKVDIILTIEIIQNRIADIGDTINFKPPAKNQKKTRSSVRTRHRSTQSSQTQPNQLNFSLPGFVKEDEAARWFPSGSCDSTRLLWKTEIYPWMLRGIARSASRTSIAFAQIRFQTHLQFNREK